jgi:N-glycosylase/DNA lyase
VKDTKHETEFSGIAYGKKISVAEDSGKFYLYGATEEDFYNIWLRYLGLDTDYDAIDRDILERSDNPALKDAVEYGRGIRILKQEPWETVCSFIISQNNNIPRIKKIISAMCEKFGEPIEDGAFAFPTARALYDAGESEIFALKTGFRAKYITDAATRICDGRLDLNSLDGSTDECVKKLCEVKGIGPKVALCSLLFGFSHFDAFPIDVWIRRVMEKYFKEGFSPFELGPYAGIAQQYLFYYERYIINS